MGFSNRSYMPNAAPLVNIYINVPGETPMPNTSTDSGAIQINIQDMRKRQQPETQGAQFSQAVVQPTQPQVSIYMKYLKGLFGNRIYGPRNFS